NRDVAAHGTKPFDGHVAHDVELEAAGGWAGGAICPLWRELPRTARSREAGAPRGFAFPLLCPGAWVFAPTNATPKTSAVRAPRLTFAPRAQRRARSIRQGSAMTAARL